jgi:hypothetical protein
MNAVASTAATDLSLHIQGTPRAEEPFRDSLMPGA